MGDSFGPGSALHVESLKGRLGLGTVIETYYSSVSTWRESGYLKTAMFNHAKILVSFNNQPLTDYGVQCSVALRSKAQTPIRG